MTTFRSESVIALDTECTGLDRKRDKPFGFSIATPSWSGYWDVREDPNRIAWLTDELAQYRGIVVMHNASYDTLMLDHWGIDMLDQNLHDTVIREYCINEHHREYGLDYLAKTRLGAKKDREIYESMAGLFGGRATRNVQMHRIADAPADIVAPYAIKDAELTLRLWQWQEKEIKRQGIQQIVDFEISLIPTFIRAERRGIRVDLNAVDEAISRLTPVIEHKQRRLEELVGRDFNVNSSPQVKAYYQPVEKNGQWYTKDGIPLPKTNTGNASLGAEILRQMENDPVAQLILQIRSDIKTRDTFLAGHVAGHAYEGRVYPSIHQTKGEGGGAGTGRVQYTGPAMGQIPDRDKEVASIVKPCFLPDEGHIWVDTDLSQFEVRVFVHNVNNPEMVDEMIANPERDIHSYVADISGLPRNATYPGQANAKQLNLSMIFNSGNGAIADKMGMPWRWDSFTARDGKVITYKKPGPEAMAVINQYHARVRGVKELMAKAKRIAENRGYVKTFTGRRLRFPNGYKTYAASGIHIQATAADLNKENWKIIEEQLDGIGHMILNTHDSYSLSLPEDWEPHVARVKSEIERPGRLRVPLILDINGAGPNWWASKC